MDMADVDLLAKELWIVKKGSPLLLLWHIVLCIPR